MKLIFLCLVPIVTNGCLVVRTKKCECSSLALDSSNIAANVGNHNFYKNVSGFPITAPKIKSEDCSISMYCEGEGLSLVVFDTDQAVMFDAFAAEGICTPSTQTWLIDDGSALKSYTRLYGACVDYAQSVTVPPKKCTCQYELVDADFAKENLQSHSGYKYFSTYSLYKPNITMDQNSCITSYRCGRQNIIILPEAFVITESDTPTNISCDQVKQYNLTINFSRWGQSNSVVTPYAYFSCSKYFISNSPPPPSNF